MRDMRNKLRAVDMGTETAGRLDHRNSVLVEFIHKIVDELRSLADVFHVK
jgi:hypothetical protein